MQEPRLTSPYIHESGLDARKNSFDLAQEDVAEDSILIRAIEHDLSESFVFTECYPRLLWVRAHENFSLQVFLQFAMSVPIDPCGASGRPRTAHRELRLEQFRRPPESRQIRAQWRGVSKTNVLFTPLPTESDRLLFRNRLTDLTLRDLKFVL